MATSHVDSDDICQICCKTIKIYAVGECNHPICYECCTRLRVLCDKVECPICTKVPLKIIFTEEKLPYLELKANIHLTNYKVHFCSPAIEKQFFKLIRHQCPRCDQRPYRYLEELRVHLNQKHRLYFCEVCLNHLRLFTFERRVYTKNELNVHLFGDDGTNLGHPTCKFCKFRFINLGDLYSHFRFTHHCCSFCKAQSINQFYRSFDDLINHYRQNHYICEKGSCFGVNPPIIFITESEYKNHLAVVHGECTDK